MSETQNRPFQVGDIVEWRSAAKGYWKTKRGVVTKVRIGYQSYGAKKQTQVITVEVPPAPRKDGKPSSAKATVYGPRVSALNLISAVEGMDLGKLG